MSHYRETIEVHDETSTEIIRLYADWNTYYDTCTVYNEKGRVIFTGNAAEAIALKKLFGREKQEYDEKIGDKFFKNIDNCY